MAYAELPGVNLWYTDTGSTGSPVIFLVWLKISAASTPVKLLRVRVYWAARSRYGLHPEERL